MHAFANMLQNMLKFGTARNFSGQIGEQALQAIVKDHAVKIQWRPNKFAEQCAIKECESRQLDFIIKDVSIQLGIDRKNDPQNTSKFQHQKCHYVHDYLDIVSNCLEMYDLGIISMFSTLRR